MIGISCNVSCLLSIIMEPYMPDIASQMRKQMNAPNDIIVLSNEVNVLLPEGHKIGKVIRIF